MIDPMIQNTDQYDILIVDDTPDSLELLGRILEEHGYRVRPAPNGRLALDSMAARLPDLILLDVKMPEMDGFEVCRRLKSDEHSRNVPVIFISAFGETVRKVEGFKAGGVDYITKPFEAAEVLARVEIHLQLHELTERLEQQVDRRTAELTLANQQLRHQILERERVEEKLRESEKRYSEIVEGTDNLITEVDAEGRFTFVNETSRRVFGLSPQECIGRMAFDCVHPDDREITHKNFLRWVEDKTPSVTFENRQMSLSGQVTDMLWTINLHFDDRGNIASIKSIARDITESKQAEAELRKLNDELDWRVLERTAELEAANKEMNAFTYTVSHDLRAPLRHIGGFLGLLQKKAGTALDEQSRHYMDAISGSAQKMGLLIDDLLSFSRMGRKALSFQPVDLGTLVRNIIRELEPDAAGRDIAWRIGDLPAVSGDAAMLRMVLANLISNALKFTRPREQAEIEIGWLRAQETEAVIFVRDNGVGFDMRHADKLFGVFQRLHRVDEFEGTGIGLASVQRIIDRHGGRTWAEGEPERGAAFFFSLPHTKQGENYGSHQTHSSG